MRVVIAAKAADARALVTAICDERLRFLQRLKTWDVFGKGWGRRVAEVKSFSLKLAAEQPLKRAPDAAPVAKAAPAGWAGLVARIMKSFSTGVR
ncbi:MAG: hypothetical protein Q7T81_15690 [Pseudolabrys sp.]|nr:hypothetical protein [Pseudolabrys sp.]